MKRIFHVVLLVAAVAGRLGAGGRPPLPVEQLPPAWRLELGGVGFDRPLERTFRAEADAVVVEGRLSFDPDGQMLRIEGTYRTRQQIDPRARLSYQVYSDDGQLLLLDGERSAWRETGAGGREADFVVSRSLAHLPELHPGFRVQFNYVVEGEFWYRDRFPETLVPELAVRGPARPAQFTVRWAWVPPVLPAETSCAFPAWIEAECAVAPQPYSAALDVRDADATARIEAPRRPLPRGNRGLVLYVLTEATGSSVLVRPGFVWDGVSWFDSYRDNPYRRVYLAGPLEYAVGLTLAGLGLCASWCALAKVKSRRLRRGGYGLWGLVALGLLATVAVSCYALLLAGVATICLLQRRIADPGLRAYWTTWIFLVLLELYWGHVNAGGAFWGGTLISGCLAAVVLLPLRWLHGSRWAAAAGTGLAFLATMVATAMAVYFDFFHDYPGLRDLLYAGQIGEVGDSVVTLIGQSHLVPWWLCGCATVGLWRRVTIR